MCVQESQLAVKAEMKVCHVPHMGAFQETDSADAHAGFGLFLTKNIGFLLIYCDTLK